MAKKLWINPEVWDLSIQNTEASPRTTTSIDAVKTDDDGNKWYSTS